MNKPYQRVLLKLSEEVFGGGKLGADLVVISGIAREIAAVVSGGVRVVVVVGSGSYFRGAELSSNGIARDWADYTGMSGIVMNAITLRDFLEKGGTHTRVQSAINMTQAAESYIPHRVERHLKRGCLVIFRVGSGIPYFSTDTVAAQCALEIGAGVLPMDKRGASGVYDSDPRTNLEAGYYERLTHDEFLSRDLEVADTTTITLVRDNVLNIIFFNLSERGSIGHVVQDKPIGMFVSR